MPEASPTFGFATPQEVLSGTDDRLVDVVDQLLEAGVVVRGELWLTVADVELVFIGADVVLASPDKMRARRTLGPAVASLEGE